MTLRALACASILTCAAASGAVAAPVTVSSRGLSATFDDGCLVGLQNRLTGERHFASSAPDTLIGLTLRSGLLKATKVLSRRAIPGGYQWAAATEGDQPAQIVTTVKVDEAGGLTVIQQVTRPRGGIGGVEWGWRGLDLKNAKLILPAVGGVVIDPLRTEQQATYEWPGSWQAAAVFVQGKRGGFWLWTEDSERHFKDLRYQRKGKTATLRFASESDGRAQQYRSFTSVTWRLAAYRGDWREPAAQYRALMERSYRLTPMARRQPDWAARIGFVLRCGRSLPRADLERLARDVPPDRTLIYLPDWRSLGYDVNYPEYSPGAGAVEWVKMARGMGFHVMVHCNFAGVNPFHPLRQNVDSMLLRDRWTGEPVGWYLDRPHDTAHQIMVLNTAYPEARRLLIEHIVQAQREVGFDAVHLDFPVLINSTHGRVGGLNALGGAEVYLRELRDALPQVAIGTEGIHEVLLQCSFAQVGETFWNANEHLGVYHPVRSHLFSPFVHPYGHLGMPDPDTALPAYLESAQVGLRLAALPTLPAGGAINWQAPGVRLAVDLGAMWTTRRMQPDFNLAPPEAMAWRGAEGFRAVIRREPEGWALRGPGQQPVALFAAGANTLPAAWSVPGWPAQDERGAFGLDPSRLYLARPAATPREVGGMARPSSPVVLQTYYGGPKRMVVEVQRFTTAAWRAADAIGEARLLMIVKGRSAPLADGGSFACTRGTCGGEQRPAILAHPPWQGGSTGGETVGEFKVRLPAAERLTLRFATGLGDIENDPNQTTAARGDGATFIIAVNGERLFSRHQNRNVGWQDGEVDLSRFAGKQIALQMITGPGPAGDVSYDWALWGDARVDAGAEQGALGFDLSAPTPVAAAVPRAKSTANAPNRYHFEGDGRSLWAALLYEVQKVSPPAKLIDLPFSAAVVAGGIGEDGSVHGSGMIGQVEMRGVALRAIGAHPPAGGRTYLDWPLALPAESCRLRLHYGVKDGGQSVLFIVAANGETLWQERVREPAGWRETVVDLGKWAGQSVLLSLITDSDGLNYCDWAQWGEPTLER